MQEEHICKNSHFAFNPFSFTIWLLCITRLILLLCFMKGSHNSFSLVSDASGKFSGKFCGFWRYFMSRFYHILLPYQETFFISKLCRQVFLIIKNGQSIPEMYLCIEMCSEFFYERSNTFKNPFVCFILEIIELG